MSSTDEYLNRQAKLMARRYEGYFKAYARFQADCNKNGISNEEIPLLWIAYQLREVVFAMPDEV